MRVAVVGCLLIAACGSGSGSGGEGFVAATVDGQAWRAPGWGELTPVGGGPPSFSILGYTRLSGSTQPDTSKPRLEMIFSDSVPTPGTYDVATMPSLEVYYTHDPVQIFAAQAGTITIAHISSSAADGTFAFTSQLVPSGPDTITFTSGSFAVPVAPGPLVSP